MNECEEKIINFCTKLKGGALSSWFYVSVWRTIRQWRRATTLISSNQTNNQHTRKRSFIYNVQHNNHLNIILLLQQLLRQHSKYIRSLYPLHFLDIISEEQQYFYQEVRVKQPHKKSLHTNYANPCYKISPSALDDVSGCKSIRWTKHSSMDQCKYWCHI